MIESMTKEVFYSAMDTPIFLMGSFLCSLKVTATTCSQNADKNGKYKDLCNYYLQTNSIFKIKYIILICFKEVHIIMCIACDYP